MELGGVISTITMCSGFLVSSEFSDFRHPSVSSVIFLLLKLVSERLLLLLLEAPELVKLDNARPRSILGREAVVVTGVTDEAVG